MLSIFNMHIQFAWGVFTLHWSYLSTQFSTFQFFPPPRSPLNNSFSPQTLIHTQMYSHSCRHAAPIFTINTISKPIESDQNANGEHGNPCSVKKKQSKHHILTREVGGGALTKGFSLQLIMHCINSLCYLVCVISGFNIYLFSLSEQRKE